MLVIENSKKNAKINYLRKYSYLVNSGAIDKNIVLIATKLIKIVQIILKTFLDFIIFIVNYIIFIW